MSIPKLPEEKAIWAADQFIEYYSKFNRIDDYLRFVKESRISKSSSKLFGLEDVIEWWKKKASKRYEKLKNEGTLRTELELWKVDSKIEIIR